MKYPSLLDETIIFGKEKIWIPMQDLALAMAIFICGPIHLHIPQDSVLYMIFPPPLSLECTWGIKYFPIKKVGVFAELGLGKSFLLFNKYFIPEALAQGGITIKL
ncbi:MAG: hypothetical protein IPK62_08255 [Bacteroidetes bacterium]|nr:hypothetical protein [Bacteroidota bacterium]